MILDLPFFLERHTNEISEAAAAAHKVLSVKMSCIDVGLLTFSTCMVKSDLCWSFEAFE